MGPARQRWVRLGVMPRRIEWLSGGPRREEELADESHKGTHPMIKAPGYYPRFIAAPDRSPFRGCIARETRSYHRRSTL